MSTTWYRISNADQVESPSLLVFPDRARENVARMIGIAGGTERLRPHVKTHKLAEIVYLQMSAGIRKFKSATIAEAEMLGQCHAEDVLLAYQPVGPAAGRFARLVGEYSATRFSTVVDDPAAVDALGRELAEIGSEVELLVDIDNGMQRTGIPPGDDVMALYEQIAATPPLAPGGLHVYDGHIHDRDFMQRQAHADAAMAGVLQLRDRLIERGLPVPRLVTGGTPTFPVHARHADRELSPGTCIFWDASYRGKFPDLDFVNAAVLLTRVISKPAARRLCLDLGYKAVASDNPDPRVVLLDVPDATMVVHSEEHLVVETELADRYHVGDPLYGIPYHVCPTTALHQEVVVVEDSVAVDRWNVAARDRRIGV